MALINLFVKSAWDKLVLACILYKRIVIKLFWTIADIVGYVIMVSVIGLLQTVFKCIILIFLT